MLQERRLSAIGDLLDEAVIEGAPRLRQLNASLNAFELSKKR